MPRISANGRARVSRLSAVLRFRLRVTKRVVSDRSRFDGRARIAMRELDRATSGHSSIRSSLVDRSCMLVCRAGTNGSLCKREFRSSRSWRSTRFRWLLFCHDYALPFRVARDRSYLAVRINARCNIGIYPWQGGRTGYAMPDEGSGVNDGGRL